MDFLSVVKQNQNLLQQAQLNDSVQILLHFYGHYRPDHFDQNVLEDLRQRLLRRGISLNTFAQSCLPFLRDLISYSKQIGLITKIPTLFHYHLKPATVSEIAPSWIQAFQTNSSEKTAHRYQLLLTRDLLPYFSDFNLLDIDQKLIDTFQEQYLSSGKSMSCFQYYPRILYLIVDFYVAQEIKQDYELVAKIRQEDTSQLFLRTVIQLWLQENSSSLSSETETDISKYILPILGQSDLKCYNIRRLQRYQRELAKRGAGEDVFNRHLALLNELIHFAVQKGLLDCRGSLTAPKRGRIAKPHLPDSYTIEKIKNSGVAFPDAVILRLALQMGLKNEEIQSLKWSNIDWEKKTVSVSNRTIPIPDDLWRTLQHLASQNGAEGYIVLTAHKKTGPVSMIYLYSAAKKVLTKLNIQDLRLSDLRSFYIVEQLQHHTPDTVTKLCGFPNTETLLQKYADYLPSNQT